VAAGTAHGCYDCSILKESDCDGSFNAHMTNMGYCAEGTEPKVAACYSGPACAAAGASHGCYDCSVTQASQCDSSFNDALSINSCLEGTAPTKPSVTAPPAPPSPPPNPPTPPPPQRMEDCKPGDGIKCGGSDVCGGVLLEKPKDPPNPTLEPCYSHAQCRNLDGTPGRGVCCVPVGTCDHLGGATSGYEGRPIVSGAMKYYVGGCEPYTNAHFSYTHNTSEFSSTSVKCEWHDADACDKNTDGTLKHPDKCDKNGNPFFDHSKNCYPTVVEGCVKQGECAVAYIEQVYGLTSTGGTLQKHPESDAYLLTDEAIDEQLVGATESSPGICRSIYKRRVITATHYAEVKVTVAGDVADYTTSVLDTMAEHLAYKMNVAVDNVKITAAAGSVILSIVVGYPSSAAASSGEETMNTAMADNTKAAAMLSTPAKEVSVEAVATASSGTGSAPEEEIEDTTIVEDGLTVAAIAGIAVGAAVGGVLILIGIGIGICCATKKKSTDAKAAPV
jgi:hypothetical protein